MHSHSMARANLKKVNTSQLLLPQHQSTYQEAQNLHQLKSPLSDPNLLKKQRLKGGTSFDADSGPFGYIL